MIFVTVGTGEQQFDRLLRSVESLSIDEPLVVQYGSSNVRPTGARCVDFMPFGDLVEHMRDARVVITHAGVGSVMTALSFDKRPVVLPRLQRLGEAVDDHQFELARRLDDLGLVTVVEDSAELAQAVKATRRISSRSADEAPLAADLRAYIAACCADPNGDVRTA